MLPRQPEMPLAHSPVVPGHLISPPGHLVLYSIGHLSSYHVLLEFCLHQHSNNIEEYFTEKHFLISVQLVFLKFNLGNLNLIWATKSFLPLAWVGHAVLKLSGIPDNTANSYQYA